MNRYKWLLPGCFATALILGGLGCHGGSQGSSPSDVKQYHVRGVVVSTDASKGSVSLDSDAIPGFMDAMIMPYQLKNPTVISELHAGDTITATLLASNDSDVLDEIDVIQQAKADYVPPVTYHPLDPGTPVPDFRLLNQSGGTIHLGQFRGKILLITFIYTRCPLADYCPRMSRNFAELDRALAKDPALYAKTHLLSVSFDPKYDTPAVLKSYGGSYTGKFMQEKFEHWDFAAPEEKELPDVLKFFVLGVTPEKDKTITHSLSTIVVGPDGMVAKWYGTNDWTPDELLKDVKELDAKNTSENKSR